MRTLTTVLLSLAVVSCTGIAAAPFAPRDGDIVFHASTSSQGEALRRATGSPYTHMGLVFVEHGAPIVLEAVGPVTKTPFSEWIARGEGGHFVVKRLITAEKSLTPKSTQRLREIAETYLGRPYDPYFEWSEDRIYCSELVWKSYKTALGIEIGALQRMAEFNLSDPVVARKLIERFGDHIPTSEVVISPASIFGSSLLTVVHEE